MNDETLRTAGPVRPRAVLRGILEHWTFLETLVEMLGEGDRLISEREVVRAADKARQHPSASKDSPTPEQLLDQVTRAGILVSYHSPGDSASEQYHEIAPEILAFIRYLVNAPSLESAGVLGSRIESLKSCLKAIQAGCENEDDDHLISSLCHRLPSEISGTRRQLRNDQRAIENMAAQIKSQETDVPLEQRYLRMFAAYDEHLQPMVDLLDTGTSGQFQEIFSYGRDVLEVADHYLRRRSRLSARSHVDSLRRSLKALVRQARLTADACRRELFPLRQAQERSTKLAAAINYVHNQVRRRGWNDPALCETLPAWPLGRKGRECVGQELASFMAELADYQPVHVPAPDIVPREEIEENRLAERLGDIVKQAGEAKGVDDLLGWIREEFDDLSGSEALAAFYHCLSRSNAELVAVAENQQSLEFRDLTITHHPFRVTLREGAPHDG